MMYIPLLETLQVVLQNENVIAEVTDHHAFFLSVYYYIICHDFNLIYSYIHDIL